MANPAIQACEYQHGTLSGYEIKEYLLRRDHHRCVYCHGKNGDPVLEIEHVISQAHGGSNRISNLAITCHTCNREKGSRDADAFGFSAIQRAADKFRAFRYSALAQSYQWALWQALQGLQMPLEGTTLGNKQATRLHRLQPVWRNRWIETRSLLQVILKEFRPVPTVTELITPALSHS